MDDATLIQYLAGESADSEVRRVEAWVGASREHAGRLAELRRAWELSAPRSGPSSEAVDRAWETLSLRLAPGPDEQEVVQRSHPPRRWLGWAAVVTAIVGSSLVASHLHHDHSAVTTFEARPGQQGRLTLSDGSAVVLAPGSTLEVRADYGESTRRVELAGEALFDVRADPTLPFHVETRRGRVVVLGTEFAVRSFEGEGVDQVAVRSGRVRFGGHDADPSLHATVASGQVGRLRDRAGSPTVAADTTPALAWTVDAWSFSASTLSEVVSELERRWGRPVRVDSAVADRRVSGAYRSESPEEMLTAISLATDTRVVNLRDTISFLPNAEASR